MDIYLSMHIIYPIHLQNQEDKHNECTDDKKEDITDVIMKLNMDVVEDRKVLVCVLYPKNKIKVTLEPRDHLFN